MVDSAPSEEPTIEIGAGSNPTARAGRVGVGPIEHPTAIGRFIVIEELGRGGMGTVLRAYDPKLQREVALKRMHSRMLSAGNTNRMVREARAMARLAHPNVVAVYDVELDDDSGVVLVMEYVPGKTLSEWLGRGPTRSWQEIIAAFVAAGRGLHAAHAEGLLHRDFKAANVLVGDDGRVRVTDFGLARTDGERRSGDGSLPEISQEAIEVTSVELTAPGMTMGTPRYMAPEQHGAQELDERADQYAFCIALWEALTKQSPFEGDLIALAVAKRQGPPAWPTDSPVPRHIGEALRRGLAPKAADRWPDMPALLAELERDPSRRRQRVLGIGALVLVAVGAWGWQRFDHARREAACVEEGEAVTETWTTARADAIETAFADQKVAYALESWTRARPRFDTYAERWQEERTAVCRHDAIEHTWSPELVAAARECLDENRARLDALLEQLSQPDTGMIQRVGTASVWLPAPAECTDEARLRTRPPPASDPAQHEAETELRQRLLRASAMHVAGHYKEAITESEAVREGAETLGSPLLVAESKLIEARARDGIGQEVEARTLLEDGFVEAGAVGGDELALEIGILLVFTVGNRLGEYDDALRWGKLTEMMAQRLGRSDDLGTAGLLDGLGQVHIGLGEYEQAIGLFRRALAIQERMLGPDDLHVAVSLNSIATALHHEGRDAEALELYQRSLAIREQALGPEHPHVAGSLNNLGNVYRKLGDLPKSIELQQRSLAMVEKAFGADSPRVVAPHNNLGESHRELAQWDDAQREYEAALAVAEKTFGPEHEVVATLLDNIGLVYLGREDWAKALEFHERALALREKALAADHPSVADSLHSIGVARWQRGEHALAIAALERAEAIRSGADVPARALAETRFALALALVDSDGDRERARRLATQAADSLRSDATQAELVGEIDGWLATQ